MKRLLFMFAFVACAAIAMADAVVAFGTNNDGRAFTAQTILAGVNGWESDVLPDGNRVAITQTPAGVGKFWNAQAVLGTWTNEAALAALNEFSGITFTAADMSDGTTLKVAANSNGSVNANLELLLDAQAEGDIVTLYTTASGWNCPLDVITVTGLEDCVIKYAPGDGGGFYDTPVFTQVNQGLNLFVITGKLTADKHVVVSSTTTASDGSMTKIGFQVAAYKVTAGETPVNIESLAVVGTFPGMTWEPAEGVAMTQDTENAAIWTATMEGVEVEAKAYEYKVTANGVWGDYELPASGNQEFVFGTEEYPAGTYNLTFTADTENHTLTLVAEKQAAEEDIYTIIGRVRDSNGFAPGFFGSMMDGTVEANDMVKGDDGLYTKTFENLTLDAGLFIQYFVMKNRTDYVSGESGYASGNTTVEADGTYNVVFTFDAENSTVTCELQSLAPPVVTIESLAVVGTFPGMSWEPTEGVALTQDPDDAAIWSVTMEGVEVEGKAYEYKVTANGVWGDYEIPASGNQEFVFGTEEYPAGTYNLTFTADTENNTLNLVVDKQAEEKQFEILVLQGNADFTEGKALLIEATEEVNAHIWIVPVDAETTSSLHAKARIPADAVNMDDGIGMIEFTNDVFTSGPFAICADKQFEVKTVTLLPNPDAATGTQIWPEVTPPVDIESLAVVGTFPGMTWEPTEGIAMTKDTENAAIWTATMENVEVGGIKYEYKVTANGVWGDYEIPASGNQEFVFGTEEFPAGSYNLKFTADTENHTLTLEPEFLQPEVKGVGVITFGNNNPGRDFVTDPFVVSGVINLEADLKDGTHLLLNHDSEGNPNGKFWTGNIAGAWSNTAAVNAMNEALGTAFVDADFAAGTNLATCDPGPGDSHSYLNLTFTNAKKNTLELYAAVTGRNGALDNVTVTGLTNVIISYAVGDGDGFVSEPTFSPDVLGITLVKIQGYLGDDKQVTVTSTSMAGEASAKNGFQMAAYTFTDEELPLVIESMAVVGTFPGMTWEPTEGVAMTKDAENPAVWTVTMENVEVEAVTYEYKVTANGKWGAYEIPASGNDSFTFGSEEYPAGVYNLTFTADTENNTLTLLVEVPEPPVEEAIYTIAGNAPFFGGEWDIDNEENTMEKGEDGIYTKTFENVTFDGQFKIEYKVVKNHSWDENWGFTYKSDTNADYVIERAGIYTLTFKFVPEGTLAENDLSVTCIAEGEYTTGINAVNAEKNDAVYNLQGIRVMNAQKGIYIINGKKYVK